MLVSGIVPNNYTVDIVPGRQQPYTVRYLRPAKKGGVRSEVFAFCTTWVEALKRIRDDDPDLDYGE